MKSIKVIFFSLSICLLLILPAVFVYAGNVHGDTVNPFLRIKSPKEGFFYFLDKPIMNRLVGKTMIFGKITIDLEVYDNESGISRVEIYIDGILKTILFPPYFEWMWDERVFFAHSIKIIAYDNAENSVMQELSVKIWSFGCLPDAPEFPQVGSGSQQNTDGFNYYRYKFIKKRVHNFNSKRYLGILVLVKAYSLYKNFKLLTLKL